MSQPSPSPTTARRLPRLAWLAVLAWFCALAPLLFWGLPSRENDALLFGGNPAWRADQYELGDAAARLRDRAAGADTDLNPLADRTQIVNLTANAAARSEILARYRTYSRQPDEIIIFRALQRMHPRELDLDPRLYQYGGVYIYAIGGLLGAGAATGLLHLSRDVGHYLEHPEAFGRFFVTARLLSLLAGAFTLLAIFRLGQRIRVAPLLYERGVPLLCEQWSSPRNVRAASPPATQPQNPANLTSWLAMLLVALSPVFITGVLEAKPHLPSACLLLWATLAAFDFVASPRTATAVRLGVLAGLSFGIVLTGLLALALWPALWWQTRRKPRSTALLLLALLLFVEVYAVCNPYVVLNAARDPSLLASNLGNSTAMYTGQFERLIAGTMRVAQLLWLAIGPGTLVAGLVGAVLLIRRSPMRGVPLAVVAIAYVAMGALLGAGKPAEFARFLLLPALLLALWAADFIAALRARRLAAGFVLVVCVAFAGTAAYVRAFALDAFSSSESRHTAGAWLAERLAPTDAVAVLQEPAPYAVPPLDFAHRTVVWLPPERPLALVDAALPRFLVLTADDGTAHRNAWWRNLYTLVRRFPQTGFAASPITWAHKPVLVFERRDVAPPTSLAP